MIKKITNSQVFKDLVIKQTETIERLFRYIDDLKAKLAVYENSEPTESEHAEHDNDPQSLTDHMEEVSGLDEELKGE